MTQPALEKISRTFTYVLWLGVLLIVGGVVGIALSPSHLAGPGGGAIGVGIVLTYSGRRARKRYKAIATAVRVAPRQPGATGPGYEEGDQ